MRDQKLYESVGKYIGLLSCSYGAELSGEKQEMEEE